MSGRPAGAAREALIALSAAVATRDPEVLEGAFQAVVDLDPASVDEVLLQSHLFVGFPTALEALARWRELVPMDAAGVDEAVELWAERGAAVCARVYGTAYAKLRRNVRAMHPDFDRWMVEGGYGRVIGRPGLDLATRELCIAALLVVWHAPRQLHSHLRGALNAGATVQEVDRAVAIAARHAAPEALEAALPLWARVRAQAERQTGTAGPPMEEPR